MDNHIGSSLEQGVEPPDDLLHVICLILAQVVDAGKDIHNDKAGQAGRQHIVDLMRLPAVPQIRSSWLSVGMQDVEVIRYGHARSFQLAQSVLPQLWRGVELQVQHWPR